MPLQIKMGRQANSPTFPQAGWSVSFLKIGMLTVLFLFMLAGVDSESEDQMGIPPAGLLCISDCSTCPVICSPPPPSVPWHPAPSHHKAPPPQTYYHSPSPPQSPPPPPPASPPPTPSWYPSWGMPPPPPYYGYYYNTPPAQGQGQGQHAYPYPYYYFYASSVPSLSAHASIFLSLLFFHLVCLCC